MIWLAAAAAYLIVAVYSWRRYAWLFYSNGLERERRRWSAWNLPADAERDLRRVSIGRGLFYGILWPYAAVKRRGYWLWDMLTSSDRFMVPPRRERMRAKLADRNARIAELEAATGLDPVAARIAESRC
jgi:hypothetical protein